jgi:hypothetical protein
LLSAGGVYLMFLEVFSLHKTDTNENTNGTQICYVSAIYVVFVDFFVSLSCVRFVVGNGGWFVCVANLWFELFLVLQSSRVAACLRHTLCSQYHLDA